MAEPNVEQDPTMEEILQSIKRIIAEDGSEGDGADIATEEVATDVEPEAVKEPITVKPDVPALEEDEDVDVSEIENILGVDKAGEGSAQATADDPEDILELLDASAEGGLLEEDSEPEAVATSEVKAEQDPESEPEPAIESPPSQPGLEAEMVEAQTPEQAEPVADDSDDVLELTDMLQEDGTVININELDDSGDSSLGDAFSEQSAEAVASAELAPAEPVSSEATGKSADDSLDANASEVDSVDESADSDDSEGGTPKTTAEEHSDAHVSPDEPASPEAMPSVEDEPVTAEAEQEHSGGDNTMNDDILDEIAEDIEKVVAHIEESEKNEQKSAEEREIDSVLEEIDGGNSDGRDTEVLADATESAEPVSTETEPMGMTEGVGDSSEAASVNEDMANAVEDNTDSNDATMADIQEDDELQDEGDSSIDLDSLLDDVGAYAEVAEQRLESDKPDNNELLSDATSRAASAAIAQFMQQTAAEVPKISGEMETRQGTTVEELLVEAMKPLLKQWLDEHLPSTVERIVQKEIRRLVPEREDA